MYSTHTDEIALDGIDIAGQMKRKERNIDIFPTDRFDKVEQTLEQINNFPIVHTEDLHYDNFTRICFSKMTHFHRVTKFLTPILLMTPTKSRLGFMKH